VSLPEVRSRAAVRPAAEAGETGRHLWSAGLEGVVGAAWVAAGARDGAGGLGRGPGVRLPIRSVLDFRSVSLSRPLPPQGGMTGNIAGVGEGCNTRRTGGWSRLPADGGGGVDRDVAVR
jgi:hypothetical protein